MSDYDDFLRDYIDRNEPHTVTATDAAGALLALAIAGETWARSVVFDLIRAALVKNIKDRRAATSFISFTDGAGRKRQMKTAVSRPQVDVDSGEVTSYQLVLAWDMGAAELNALLRDLQRADVEVRGRIAAVRALLKALADHPKCETARQAWAAAGRSVDEIDLSA